MNRVIEMNRKLLSLCILPKIQIIMEEGEPVEYSLKRRDYSAGIGLLSFNSDIAHPFVNKKYLCYS